MWDDMRSTAGPGVDRRLIAAAVLAVIGLIGITWLLLTAGSGPKQLVSQSSVTTFTSVPQTPATGPPTSQGAGSDQTPLYPEEEIPISPNAPLKMPESEAGIDPTVSANAKDIARAFVTAKNTGEGRDQFPGYFTEKNLPCCSSIGFDTAQAALVNNDPHRLQVELYWHGKTVSSNYELQYQRAVVQIEVGSNKSLRVLRPEEIPAVVSNS